MSTRRAACDHDHIDVLPGKAMRCRDCGELLTEDEEDRIELDLTAES